jgi:hypothetical protein
MRIAPGEHTGGGEGGRCPGDAYKGVRVRERGREEGRGREHNGCGSRAVAPGPGERPGGSDGRGPGPQAASDGGSLSPADHGLRLGALSS